ncbi:MAG: hypothetical protein ACXVFM_11370 [Solirubrobacteraceae bacterium]
MTAEIAMTAPTDADVIARAQVEPAAFAAIFDRHHEAIHTYLRRRLDAPIAEELAAETFTRALHGVGRYDHGYRALALVPGVQLLGNVHDRLGRAAIGVAFNEHTGMRQELLFDPDTAEIRNEREVVAHRVQEIRAAVGTAIEDVVYTRRAVTDSTARP